MPGHLTPEDWRQIRAEYERHRHGVFPEADGYHARNFRQQWLARFDGRGVTVEPDGAAWRWGLELEGTSGKAHVSADVNRVSYRWSDGLEEWFVNSERGLEHGFTLASPRKIRLAVRGGLRARETAAGVEFVEPDGLARVTYTELVVRDAGGKPVLARMRVERGGVVFTVDDRRARYPVTIDPIAQQAYIKASNTDAGDRFGGSVALSGDTLVVGATGEASSARGVNGDQSNNFAPGSGAAYVFVRNGTTWTQQAYLKASNADPNDGFGSVAIDGDTIVIGAAGEDSDAKGVNGDQNNDNAFLAGAAYVFVRTAGVWTQQAYLKASNTDPIDQFGSSVAISGNTVIVATPWESGGSAGVNGDQSDNSVPYSGAAYVFVRTVTAWNQQAYLKASNPGLSDFFGRSVSLSGDTLVVGAVDEDSNAKGVNGNQSDNGAINSGAAYVFVRSSGAWAQQAYLKASNTDTNDFFGIAVSISGDTLVVGAAQESSNATGVNGDQLDNSAFGRGAAYVFVRTGTFWAQQAYLKAPATSLFGISVAVSGNTIVTGGEGGGAFVFVRTGGSWAQRGPLLASNFQAGDGFGVPVALSANTAVAGATGEDSNATGVNGDQANNSAADSGAAYAFVITPDTPPIIFAPTPNQTIAVSGVTFQWAPVAGASGYDLRITQGAATLFQGNVAATGATSTLVSLADGSYMFQLRACMGGFADLQCGGFTNVDFVVAQARPSVRPSITVPSAGQEFTSSTQTFSWSSVAGASSYEIRLIDVAAGGTTELAMAIGGNPPPTSTVFSMRGSTNYQLQARACTGGCGPWSDPVSFKVTIPAVPTIAPGAPNCTLAALTASCSWNTVANADYYTIQAVQPTAGPGGGALTVAGLRTTQTNGSVTLPPGPVSMFVAGCNGNGCGPYSTPTPLNPVGANPNAPQIGNPVSGSTIDGPDVFFSWNRVSGDNGSNTVYRLYVQDFSRQAPALDVLTKSNFWSAKFRGDGSRYDAVVVANGVTGPAAPFLVRGASPASPTMAQPRHQSQDVTLTVAAGNVQLGWTPVPNATLYEYLVSVQGQAQPTARGVTPGLLVQVPLPANATFYSGIVRACPAAQTCAFGLDAGWGPWSSAPGQGGVTNFLTQ
ncbi:MAG: FG-GAP repeat protein [Bryobacteraceae bacterium]